MKIAIINKYQTKVFRGAERFVEEISKRLKKNLQVDIISEVNYLDLFKKKYDLIIPINGRTQVILVRIITWLTGGKMVVSGQSGMGFDDRINLYSFPNVFVALSSEAKKWAKKINPFVKVEYIPNGVDLNKFTSTGEKINIDLKKPVILCVAALTKTKRIDLVIKAVSRLENASLLIVGKGSEEKYLNRLGKKLLGERFEINNYSFDLMPKVYRSADVFTIVSESYYSFEIVLVEALASGIPVVANNDPIRKEIVGDAGILVDPENCSKYAKSLEKAISTKWRDKLRKRAEKFDWYKIANKYEDLITRLCK